MLKPYFLLPALALTLLLAPLAAGTALAADAVAAP